MRIFCQYNYGGFSTYRISGTPKELLQEELPSDSPNGFPPLADVYFSHGGAKLLYRFLDSRTLDLVVCNIPGPEKDTDGRAFSCAVQFIGDLSEKELLDCLTVNIVSDLNSFEQKFASMFSLRGGLHFKGDLLMSFVNGSLEISEQPQENTLLKALKARNGDVLLFIPTSKNFGVDPTITEKIMSELKLPKESMSPDWCFSVDKLEALLNSDTPNLNKDNNVSNSANNTTQKKIGNNNIIYPSTCSTGSEIDISGQKDDDFVDYRHSKKNIQQTLFIFFGVLFAISLIIGVIKFFFLDKHEAKITKFKSRNV